MILKIPREVSVEERRRRVRVELGERTVEKAKLSRVEIEHHCYGRMMVRTCL